MAWNIIFIKNGDRMHVLYGLKLQPGEKILWMGKRCLKSLWHPFLIGLVSLPIYGIGTIFILYAIVTWLKTDYIITSTRVVKVTRHYAFVYLISYDIEEIKHEEIKSIYTIFPHAGGIFHYCHLIIENEQKIIFKGLKNAEEAKRTFQKLMKK